VGLPFPRFCSAAKGREKFLSTKIQRNPLKMLDFDKRIQGNPSLPNLINQGFRGQTARAQENPNRADRDNLAPAAERELPTSSKCKAVWGLARGLVAIQPAIAF
jgi:hypothetical protein